MNIRIDGAWGLGREEFREQQRVYAEKIDRIALCALECMNKEGITLSEVDTVTQKIKAATTRQVEAALKELTVKVSV